MTQLEGIIRPFETGNISPAKPAPVGEGDQPDNVVIQVKGTPPKTFSGQFSITVTYYHVRKPKEKKKTGSSDDISGGPSAPPPVAGNESPPAGFP